jgi:DNA topoisomerase IB
MRGVGKPTAVQASEELVHVHGGEPGLRRKRPASGFVYLDREGGLVRDPDLLARIAALRIPPAWTEVWISPVADSHLQATGLDAKRRRQYLYHPAWRERREREKFDDMLSFAARLPPLRITVNRHIAGEGVPRERALALALRLLDVGLFRVGWDRYARDNGHVGLTTLRREDVLLEDDAARFDFVAKSGKRRRMTVRDPESLQVLRPLKRRRSGPPELLAFRAEGGWRRIHAPDVNNALRAWAAGPFSAKEFRTWAATVLAAVSLSREHAAGRRGKRTVARAVRDVSTALGNTPTVARASYIDPRVIESFARGDVIELPSATAEAAGVLLIDEGPGGVVIELPTHAAGDALREEVERRVLELLRAAPPAVT